MATYQELRALFNDSDLMEKVEVAVVVAANDLATAATPTTAQKAWAAQVAANPSGEAQTAMMFVLAQNKGQSVATIQGATDAALQNNVNSVVPVLVDALAGA